MGNNHIFDNIPIKTIVIRIVTPFIIIFNCAIRNRLTATVLKKGIASMLTKRSIWIMALLTLVTGGLYLAYWFVVTKWELSAMGAQLPTAFLFFIPFVNIYFIYKFSQAFAQKVLKNESEALTYFLLLFLLMPIGGLIAQSKINNFINKQGLSSK